LNARALYIGSEDLVSERPSDRVKIDVSHHRLNIAFFERVHERIQIVQGPSYITEPHQAKGCQRHYCFMYYLAMNLLSRTSRSDGTRVKLYSRPENDLTDRFSLIVEAQAGLRSRSCITDGQAVACDERGIAAACSSMPSI